MRQDVSTTRRRDSASVVRNLVNGLRGRRRSGAGMAGALHARDLGAMAEELLSRRGEVSGAALAEGALAVYAASGPEERLDFLKTLATRFGADHDALAAAVAAYNESGSEAAATRMHRASEARRQELLRRLNMAPGGTAALVAMRAELLTHLPELPDLQPVDDDFRHLFASWFNRGFLSLEEITWETPAVVLERIIAYEAVHEIDGWDALRRRLAPTDRKCFAFFHPQLRHDPLVFVEVALTGEDKTTIGELVDSCETPIAAEDATTAVFYSISNCQPGLRGISFGNLLIKQVVADLRRQLPNLKTFMTLSPLPGFASWLAAARAGEAEVTLPEGDLRTLQALDLPDWAEDPDVQEGLRSTLCGAAATYLARARRKDGKPLDPVARFHLGNGARLERIIPMADPSPNGMRAAHGMMVNYLYDPDRIEENHERFAQQGEVVISAPVRKLVRPAGRAAPERVQ